MTTAAAFPQQPSRRHVAIIPCRWGATRFPGKPLALLDGMPLLWHVHRRCMEAASINEAVVATDDERIEAACRQLGIPSMMTNDQPTGTDRVAECAERIEADAYINVQGDEPFISPAAIDAVSKEFTRLGDEILAINAFAELAGTAAVLDHNVVKVVVAENGQALFFSRQPIPYPHGTYPIYSRQLGLYGFTRRGLEVFHQCRQGPLEQAEGIEMLRFIEHGHQVRMVAVMDNGLSIDNPQDLERARRLFTDDSPLY